MSNTRTKRLKDHNEKNDEMNRKLRSKEDTKGEYPRRPEIQDNRRRQK